MGEIAAFINRRGQLPANALIQYPSGTWGFAGRVSFRLGYQWSDGREIQDVEQDKAFAIFREWQNVPYRKSQNRPVVTRSFPTAQAAIEAASLMGLDVTQAK